jgi:hypothetical protein
MKSHIIEIKAAVYGKDRGLEFASGHQLDPLSAERIPANRIGRPPESGRSPKAPAAAREAPGDASQEEAACAIGATAEPRYASP